MTLCLFTLYLEDGIGLKVLRQIHPALLRCLCAPFPCGLLGPQDTINVEDQMSDGRKSYSVASWRSMNASKVYEGLLVLVLKLRYRLIVEDRA